MMSDRGGLIGVLSNDLRVLRVDFGSLAIAIYPSGGVDAQPARERGPVEAAETVDAQTTSTSSLETTDRFPQASTRALSSC
jgi:hypothetical protein